MIALPQDDRAWATVAPMSIPFYAHVVANGGSLVVGNTQPEPGLECPRCGFESMLRVPMTAHMPVITPTLVRVGTAVCNLPPVWCCSRCVDAAVHG